LLLPQLTQIIHDQLGCPFGRIEKRQQGAMSSDGFQLHHFGLVMGGGHDVALEACRFQAVADGRVAPQRGQGAHHHGG